MRSRLAQDEQELFILCHQNRLLWRSFPLMSSALQNEVAHSWVQGLYTFLRKTLVHKQPKPPRNWLYFITVFGCLAGIIINRKIQKDLCGYITGNNLAGENRETFLFEPEFVSRETFSNNSFLEKLRIYLGCEIALNQIWFCFTWNKFFGSKQTEKKYIMPVHIVCLS